MDKEQLAARVVTVLVILGSLVLLVLTVPHD
jgi:hypothetical protein